MIFMAAPSETTVTVSDALLNGSSN